MTRILRERRDGVLLLRLNRPDKLNAIDAAMLGELCAALKDARVDDAVRVVVLTGNERAFSAGADIDGFAGVTVEELATSRSDLPQWDTIRRFPKPLIAAVSGYVFGGGLELALACDIIVAAQGPVRSAGNQDRAHSRGWRDATLGPSLRQVPGDGTGADRPRVFGGGGRTLGSGQPDRPSGRVSGASTRTGVADRAVPAGSGAGGESGDRDWARDAAGCGATLRTRTLLADLRDTGGAGSDPAFPGAPAGQAAS